MNKSARLRWLFLILFLEAALFLSVSSIDALLRAVKIFQAPTEPVIRSIPGTKVLAQYSFENPESLKPWEEKIFKSKTQYQILSEGDDHFLKSKSIDACSGLYVKVDVPTTPDLYLSWRWRALSFPKKKDPDKLSNKKEDDFAARVYIIFLGANFFKSDVIEYIWDEKIPTGTAASSPYSDRIKLYVLRNGPMPEASRGWFEEERNVAQDYQKLYGKPPGKPVGAVALMSDSDNTGTSSEADFGKITLKTKLAN